LEREEKSFRFAQAKPTFLLDLKLFSQYFSKEVNLYQVLEIKIFLNIFVKFPFTSLYEVLYLLSLKMLLFYFLLLQFLQMKSKMDLAFCSYL